MKRTITQITQANKDAGKYFFSPGAMQFFNSKVDPETWERPGGGEYFLTSEQVDEKSPRRWTIRRALTDGAIATVGDLGAYDTRSEAVAAIGRCRTTSPVTYNA